MLIKKPAPASATKKIRKIPAPLLSPDRVHQFLMDRFLDDLHAKRVLSLTNGVLGVLHAAAAGVHAIGLGLATARGLMPKHAVKQVDRLLSNFRIDPLSLALSWVAFVLAKRTEAVVIMDWTDFDDDDQTTCALHVVTTHGRATPLLWKTVFKSELKGHQHQVEDELLSRLHNFVPPHVCITLIADRGFGDQRRYDYCDAMGWDYVIRFRADILVTNSQGLCKPAQQWLAANGRATMLRGARVTGDQQEVGAVVSVHDKRMEEAWYLATSRTDLTARQVVLLYGRRFTIEENFRDTKDLRFGLGLSATHVGDCGRRDRLLLLIAIAQGLLTLLGAASEAVGLDRLLKVNTVKRRTHSLFRQGSYWFQAVPTMPEEWLLPLMKAFEQLLSEHAIFREAFGAL